eukprot:11220414-Lingulodinium_polyedra.AAC.1
MAHHSVHAHLLQAAGQLGPPPPEHATSGALAALRGTPGPYGVTDPGVGTVAPFSLEKLSLPDGSHDP